METLPQCRAAEDFERFLGDPADPTSRIPTARVLELDEEERFPEELLAPAFEWGFHRRAIPASLGGELRSFEELYYLTRVLTRRDMVVGNVLGTTLLGSMFTWLAGSPELQARLAAMIDARGLAGLALTEEAHGSDSAASEVTAVPVSGGYELTGTKWLINNVSRSGALTVLAAVLVEGRRELGMFLVEKSALAPGTFSYLPKIRCVGVKGLDLGGVRFDKAFLAPCARIGSLTMSMDTLMRGLYVTRALCAGLSMGTADTALRTVLRFARGRVLYGDTVLAIPDARGKLVNALLDLWICDCVTIAALRSVHAAPAQIGVSSAVVKYFVPTTVEALVRELSVVLGARYYVREGAFAIFQKMQRDGAVVSLFDGSTAVNLYLLGAQLDALARGQAKRAVADEAVRRTLFSLEAPLPDFAPAKLSLSSGGRDLVVEGLEGALQRVDHLGGEAEAAIASAARTILAERARDDADHLRGRLVREEPAEGEPPGAPGAPLSAQARMRSKEEPRSQERFLRAKRYAIVHAAAACVQVWLHNRDRLGPFFASGRWLALGLGRLVGALGQPPAALPRAWSQEVADELVRLADEGQMFSIVPTRIAQAEGA
jgi:alkylation response protein AidB-like acyl-CoA dehydrogenase